MYNTAKTLILVPDLLDKCLRLMNLLFIFRLQAKPQFDLHANPGPFSCLSVTCSCLTRYCKTFPTCKNTKPRKAIMMVELSYK